LTRIEKALERLGAAVDRLEEAGLKRVAAMMSGGDADEAEMARLTAELSAVRTDYESLQLTSRQASGRIDKAIGRLRAVLEA
jgi:uncharacterized protein involved in exopolysaccharide biosynthesis